MHLSDLQDNMMTQTGRLTSFQFFGANKGTVAAAKIHDRQPAIDH